MRLTLVFFWQAEWPGPFAQSHTSERETGKSELKQCGHLYVSWSLGIGGDSSSSPLQQGEPHKTLSKMLSIARSFKSPRFVKPWSGNLRPSPLLFLPSPTSSSNFAVFYEVTNICPHQIYLGILSIPKYIITQRKQKKLKIHSTVWEVVIFPVLTAVASEVCSNINVYLRGHRERRYHLWSFPQGFRVCPMVDGVGGWVLLVEGDWGNWKPDNMRDRSSQCLYLSQMPTLFL